MPVYYAGHTISSDYLHQLLATLKDKRVTVVVISKSGTTTEPAIAFRVIKKLLESQYQGEELKKRIICVTDEKKGALRKIADKEGYRSFIIPDDVGGRFSILTSVGLVPLAAAGVDIQSLVEGARKAEAEYAVCDLDKNTCYRYAALRNILYARARKSKCSLLFIRMFFMWLNGSSSFLAKAKVNRAKVFFRLPYHVHRSSFHGPMDAGGRAHGI